MTKSLFCLEHCVRIGVKRLVENFRVVMSENKAKTRSGYVQCRRDAGPEATLLPSQYPSMPSQKSDEKQPHVPRGPHAIRPVVVRQCMISKPALAMLGSHTKEGTMQCDRPECIGGISI